MRPDIKYDRIRRVKSSRARVNMTADLGWLSGFPVRQVPEGIVWRQCTPDQNPLGSEILVDRDKIRRAEFTLHRFGHEYSQELVDVVPESDQWIERVHRLLDHFKAAIHLGQPLPACLPETIDAQPASVRNLRRNLLRQHPALEPLDNAFSWRLYLEPTAVRSTMLWLADNACQVQVIMENNSTLPQGEKWAWMMSLRRMAHQHGDERTATLLRCLGERRLHETPYARDEYVEFLQMWASRLRQFEPSFQHEPFPEPPKATLADQIHNVAIWIAQQPKATQAHALDLFNLLVDDNLFEAWYAFVDRVEAAVSLARRMTGASTASQFKPQATKNHAAFFNSLARQEFPDIRLQELPETLKFLCKPDMRPVREELLRTLPCFSLGSDSGIYGLRQDFCDAVMEHASYNSGPHLASVLGLFRQYLAGGDANKLLAPWLGTGYRFSVIFTSDYQGPGNARKFFTALRSLVERDTTLTGRDIDNVERLASELPDVTDVMECFQALTAVGLDKRHVDSDSIRCAFRLRSHGVDFGICVNSLEKMGTISSAPVIGIVDALQAAGQVGIAANLVRHGEYGLLIAAGRRLEILRGLFEARQPIVVATVTQPASDWIHKYPPSLCETLTRLAAATTDAEPIARRVLAKDWPLPEAITTEIAALLNLRRTQPGNTHLEIRLANLQARQHTPSVISPVRLDKLRKRLDVNGARVGLECWLRQREEQFHAKLHTLLDSTNIPDWVGNVTNLRLVSAISKLEGRIREIGLQLIRRRCGSPPWDFHAEPANQAFLSLLRKQGIDPGPLVEPPADISIEDLKGRCYQLGIERDPLEVLRMGEPFDTCLSPDGGNFFSAVVNAVDINKRVIYARDARGMIVGRCLLAVTDQGRLLTFRVYSNIKELDLQAAVSQYVEAMARSMGTYVAKRGTVPKLVAPEWYDDGPQDLGSQFNFLAPGSPFREGLAKLPLRELLPTIGEAFAPLPPDEIMLALVLELEEFDKRPELILPLIPMLESAKRLPETLRWRAAARAYKAGRLDFATQVLNGRILTSLVRKIGQHGVCPCCSEPALRTLVELDPTTALRAIRLTRYKSICCDEAEEDGLRRDLLASAHRRLGRNSLADRLRRSRVDNKT